MCGFNSIHHDVNVCHYERTMVNLIKLKRSENVISQYEKGGCCYFYRCY